MQKRESHAYAELVQERFNRQQKESGKDYYHHYVLSVDEGRKFDKVYTQSWVVNPFEPVDTTQRAQRIVLAFVEIATGKLIKPAGWNTPAKWGTDWASKFNLKDNLQEAVEASDPFGSFLYK